LRNFTSCVSALVKWYLDHLEDTSMLAAIRYTVANHVLTERNIKLHLL